MENSNFVKGWQEALEAVETRLEFLKKELQEKGKHDPWDLFFDVQNAVREVKMSA